MRQSAALFFCAAALAGCQSTLEGAPAPSLDAGRDILDYSIRQTLAAPRIDAALAFDASEAARNAIVFARMAEIDRLYFAFERDLSRESRDSDLAVAIASLAAGIGGTLASNGVSQAFSAASTAVAGLNEAFDKNILVERTIASLASQMRANRALVRTAIYSDLGKPVGKYPLIAALNDLERYYQAGTLAGGLLGIAEVTTRQEAEASKMAAEAEQEFRVDKVDVVAVAPQPAQAVARPVVASQSRIMAAISAAPDDVVLRLVSSPPTAGADTVAAIAAWAPMALTDAGIARTALRAAVSQTVFSDADLRAWAIALGVQGG